MIYFDHNSTTRLSPKALAKMNEVYALPLNASATHQLGRKATKMVDEARNDLRELCSGQNYEVIFTGSSTEATNMVMFGADVKTILFCQFEHSSVYNCRPVDKEIIEIEALPNGLIDIADLEKKLPKNGNFLMSIMLANNETGAIQPVEQIAKLVHQKGGLLHCDIVQALGKIEIDLEKLNADYASVSAHKICGPQGVGALLMRKGLDIKPLIHGGKQEKSKRAGTTNVAGIAGFGAACKESKEKLSAYKKVEELRAFIEEQITKIAGDDAMIFANQVARLPNTSYIAARNIDAQTQLINFDLNGICVSAGPACSSGTSQESRVLKAMKIDPQFSASAIRASLSVENTKEEAEKFIAVWSEFYKKAKK